MADAVSDNSTGWISFFTYCRQRAAKIIPVTAREQEAERLTFEQVLNRELELRWQDVDGREYIGLPPGFGFYSFYDQSADAIREAPFGGRTLYQPRVRDPQCKLDKSAASEAAVRPNNPTNESTSEVGGSEPADEASDEAAKPDESAKPDEADEHDEQVIDEFATPVINQWPWQSDPILRKPDGSEPRRIQVACEQKLEPSIRGYPIAKICKKLEEAGVSDISPSSVRRAFGRR